MDDGATPPTEPKKFTTLRDFIATAISGGHTVEEVNEILDNIEQGVGLMEHERQYAEELENLPANDEEDPAFLRGRDQGVTGAARALYPLLKGIEWRGGSSTVKRCPCCNKRRGPSPFPEHWWPHKEECALADALKQMLRALPGPPPATTETPEDASN